MIKFITVLYFQVWIDFRWPDLEDSDDVAALAEGLLEVAQTSVSATCYREHKQCTYGVQVVKILLDS